MAEEDEIRLVDRTELVTFEEDGDLFGGEEREDDDQPITLKINHDERDTSEESEPRVEDERHIRHPGKLKMRLRVRCVTPPHMHVIRACFLSTL